MKKIFTLMLLAAAACGTASAQYQLANSGFENWESVSSGSKSGNEPVQWNSFVTMQTKSALYETARANQLSSATDVRPGTTGSKSAKIVGRKVMTGIYAQGNLTTGCIYGGNMSAATATEGNGNYNFTNKNDAGQSMKFTGRPDAIEVWLKSSTTKTTKIAAYLHADGYFQDPPEGAKSNVALIAKATSNPASNGNTWTKYIVPFVYESAYATEGRPAYALVSFATSSEPGKGAETDVMYVDDVVMVYNSELETAKYNDAVVTFTNGAATVDAEYDENNLVLMSNGKGATIEKSYDAATGLLTITVKGDNISEDATNKHVYTIQFAIPKAKATMSVSDAGWGTFCAPFEVTTPRGVKAYVVTGKNTNGVLELTDVTTISRAVAPTAVKIPANTPVVLESKTSFESPYEGIAVDDTPVYGLLTGVYTETTAPEGSYVLQNQDGRVGFYLVEPGTLVTVQPNRCYLTLSSAGSNARALFFGEADLVTALDNAIIVDKPEAALDLQGRRVSVAGQKGIFIVGGRKVIK